MCYDTPPAGTRERATAIAADLFRNVEGEHRPLACEAARKLRDMHDDAMLDQGRLEQLREDNRDMRATIERQNAIIQGADADERKFMESTIGSLKLTVSVQRDEILFLLGICERAALAICHAGVPDDGTHPISSVMVDLRVGRTDRFAIYREQIEDAL